MSSEERSSSHLLRFLEHLEQKRRSRTMPIVDLVEGDTPIKHRTNFLETKIEIYTTLYEEELIDQDAKPRQSHARRRNRNKNLLFRRPNTCLTNIGKSMKTRKQKRQDFYLNLDDSVEEICTFYTLTHPQLFRKKPARFLPYELRKLKN